MLRSPLCSIFRFLLIPMTDPELSATVTRDPLAKRCWGGDDDAWSSRVDVHIDERYALTESIES